MTRRRCTPAPRGPPELPNDVVWRIFSLFSTAISTSEPGLFPWFLGHICSSWRFLFLSMRVEFWDNIMIAFGPKVDDRTQGILRFFLERDPTAPFSFEASIAVPCSESYRQAVDHFRQWALDMLVDESMRWKNVTLRLFTEDLLPFIRVTNRLPLLQVLWLHTVGPSEGVLGLPFDAFQNAPSLHTIDMLDIAGWKFNWPNLKVVNLNAGRSFEFIAPLLQMTKLERLCMFCPLSATMIPPCVILLPSLTALECGPHWLRCMKTPSLRDLRIRYPLSTSLDLVLSFLLRSSCGFKIMRLGIIKCSAATAIEIIRHTPRIVHLKLVFVADFHILFERLLNGANHGREPLARHILSLDINNFGYTSVCEKHIVCDMIKSLTIDNRNCETLQEVRLDGKYLMRKQEKSDFSQSFNPMLSYF